MRKLALLLLAAAGVTLLALFVGRLFERGLMGSADVVDEDVDTAQLRLRFAYDALRPARLCEIGVHVQRLSHARVPAAAARDDACSFLHEQPGGRASDPAGRAGDDADGVAQSEIHGWLA